jgi:hypothetical protein
MKAPILFLIAGLAVGAGVVLVANPMGDGDKSADAALAEATARIEALEAKLKEKGSGLEVPSISPSPVAPDKPHIAAAEDKKEEEKPADADPRAAFANMMNSKEARSLMKQAMSAFGNNSERFVSGMVNRYKDSLGLSDDQVSSITKRLAESAKKQQAAFAEGLDNENKTVEELMREQGGGWQGQQEEMAAILKEELTEDQYAQYEREQLVQQAQRVERQSQRELDRLNSKLELTETQQDQVFDSLVRTSPGYDASMQIEGVGATTQDAGSVDGAADQEAARQAAIRAVLTPEQAVKYDEDLANPAPASRWGGGGFGGFGGGGFGGGFGGGN